VRLQNALLAASSLLLTGCVTPCITQPARTLDRTPVWQLVYRHDADGRRIAGDEAELIAAIRRGAPVRFAWGVTVVTGDGRAISVEHVAEPVFLTIVNESDVVVHLPEHIAQKAYGDMSGAVFDSAAVMWRGLMTTEGAFDAVWVNRATGEEIRRYAQRVGLSWFAFQAREPVAREPVLELAVPGGVRRADAPQ
jgi:hypothetical protein